MKSDNLIETIRARIKLSQFVSNYVKLKSFGNKKEGLCPFHNEKTPSFTVNDERGLYYCFGCKEGGNLFTFAQKILNITFIETLKMFAEKLNIKMDYRNNNEKTTSVKNIQNLLNIAAKKFSSSLEKSNEALKFLENRDKNLNTTNYKIGFASHEATQYLLDNFTKEDLLESGIFYEYQGKLLNRFLTRLIFPIHNKRGDVIGFGARALNKTARAKYINSPENKLFDKKKQLYGEFQYKKGTKLIISEGYFDAIKISQYENYTGVATMGTALSNEQIESAWSYDSCPIIMFDGDEAGRKAMTSLLSKIFENLRPGFSFSFSLLPFGKDPFDISEKDFHLAVRNKLPLHEYLLFSAQNLYSESLTPESKARMYNYIQDMIALITDDTVKMFYKNLLYTEWKSKFFLNRKKTFDIVPSIQNENLYLNIIFSVIVTRYEIFDHIQDHLLDLEIDNNGNDADYNNFLSKVRMYLFEYENSNLSLQDYMVSKDIDISKLDIKRFYPHISDKMKDIIIYKKEKSEEIIEFIQILINKYNESLNNSESSSLQNEWKKMQLLYKQK